MQYLTLSFLSLFFYGTPQICCWTHYLFPWCSFYFRYSDEGGGKNLLFTCRIVGQIWKHIVISRDSARQITQIARARYSSLIGSWILYLCILLEWFSNEYRKTKTKVITLITRDADNPMNELELKANTCSRRQARENACRQDTIGFGFTSDWLRKWRKIFLANYKA